MTERQTNGQLIKWSELASEENKYLEEKNIFSNMVYDFTCIFYGWIWIRPFTEEGIPNRSNLRNPDPSSKICHIGINDCNVRVGSEPDLTLMSCFFLLMYLAEAC
jgi:hypothetical protein